MPLPSCELLLISLSSPLLLGVYENGILKQCLSSQAPSSDAIIELLSKIKKIYKIERILYTNGPGSFMGLKVSYVILRIFCDINDIAFSAISAFSLNNNAPINAKKGFCFILKNDEIIIEKGEGKMLSLPKILNTLKPSNDTLPNYILDAI